MTVENSGNTGEHRDEFSDAESLDNFTLGDITTEYTLPFMEFDSMTADFLNAAAIIYADKDPESIEEFTRAARTLIAQFGTCIKTILNDTNKREKRTNDIVQLMWREDEEQIKVFNLINPCADYDQQKWSKSDLESMVETVFDSETATEETLPNLLTKAFALGLQNDINHLLSHLDLDDGDEGEFEQPHDVVNLLAKTFGGHVLDVLKTTVSVAGALVVAGAINKRLNRK
jgi:hypothetical protein